MQTLYDALICTTHYTRNTPVEEERANLTSLGLDRATLEKQRVAPHHINRVYSLLHNNAMAFALTVATEQRRLAALFTTKVGAWLHCFRLLGR